MPEPPESVTIHPYCMSAYAQSFYKVFHMVLLPQYSNWQNLTSKKQYTTVCAVYGTIYSSRNDPIALLIGMQDGSSRDDNLIKGPEGGLLVGLEKPG